MGKFNEKKVSKSEVIVTNTHQGGLGYTQKPEYELIGILSTGIQNTYYEKETERETRFREIFNKVASKNVLFAAKALIYARTVFGQRSVTHYGAVELIPHLSGTEIGKKFFSKRERNKNAGGIIYRLDDMTEILACYLAKNKSKNGEKPVLPNSIKKGFKDAIENSDAYVLAKYQGKNNEVSLVDIVNLVHPAETAINGVIMVEEAAYLKAIQGSKKFADKEYKKVEGKVEVPALRALVLGILHQFNTVEDKNTETGKVVAEKVKSGLITKEQAAVELNESKTENYKELIETKKIGYLALLRNLRNIIKTNDVDLLDKACELLVQEDFIKKSLIWPHLIDLCLEIMLTEFSGVQLGKVANALGVAYECSIPNLKTLLPEGRTAVVFDTSGSMSDGACALSNNGRSRSVPAEKAALVAATFAKGINGDVYHFASGCEKITGWNPMDSVNTLKQKFMSYSGRLSHGTDFGSWFPLFVRRNERYDRIVVISDEQDGYGQTEKHMAEYVKKFGTPYIYIINITGYGPTAMKAGSKTFRLFGYTQNIYEDIPKLEINPQVVIDAINAIEI